MDLNNWRMRYIDFASFGRFVKRYTILGYLHDTLASHLIALPLRSPFHRTKRPKFMQSGGVSRAHVEIRLVWDVQYMKA